MDIDVNASKQNPNPHVCGSCSMGFPTEAEYLDHVCGETGYKPVEPEHLGKAFMEVSKKALQRGKIRKELEVEGVDPEAAKIQAFEIQMNPKARTSK